MTENEGFMKEAIRQAWNLKLFLTVHICGIIFLT